MNFKYGLKLVLFSALVMMVFLLYPIVSSARRGCCSWHGGVAGCSANGRQICRDGTLSPTCTCAPTINYVYGCTDSSANNYNPQANRDDGSCTYTIYGCTDSSAKNYNKDANEDDNSCEYYVYGCTDSDADNYDYKADKDDGSCTYTVYGCTDSDAINYDEDADLNDGSCEYDDKLYYDGLNPLVPITAVGLPTTAAAVYYYKKKHKHVK